MNLGEESVLRVVFMGTPDFALPTLERMVQGRHEVVGVVTRPDRPRGRGLRPAPPPVKVTAERLGLPVLQPESLKAPEFLSGLRDLEADLFVVVAFLILPEQVLRVPKWGSVNLHPSLLPRYRGAAPIQWAVIQGERETGVTIFRLNPRVDAGDILLQRRVSIGPDETYGELYERLKAVGAEAMVEAVDALARGDATPAPQPEAKATRAPKLAKEDARIDWTRGAESIRNLIRGTNPLPGAFTGLRGKALKVHRAAVAEGRGAPGEVVSADPKSGLVVAAGDGALSLLEVQLAGKRKMDGAAFVRGHRIEPGLRLG